MSTVFHFNGVIRNVSYSPTMAGNLKTYPFEAFNINTAKGEGIIRIDDAISIGISKWISPKRTRSFPFARLYSTYHLPKRITVIPVIKDEGAGGDNDRINFITFSWMNLANIYVIFAHYNDAARHRNRDDKITAQKFDADYINEKIAEILRYQQTALHWNIMHFERDFEQVYRQAIDAYQRIGNALDVPMHRINNHVKTLESFVMDNKVSLDGFKQATLPKSLDAARRETVTTHELEYLTEETKSLFSITNWLGGEYHLTADEILRDEDGTIIIREAKNASRAKLPSLNDIKDGLFKLILFANMHELYLEGVPIPFRTELRLTGNLREDLTLPASDEAITHFSQVNRLTKNELKRLTALNGEAIANQERNLTISLGQH